MVGSAGNIGRHLCHLLHLRGYEVVGLQRAPTQVSELLHPPTKTYYGDLADQTVVRDALGGIGTVVFVAGVGLVKTLHNRQNNCDINVALASALRDALSRSDFGGRLIYLSTIKAGSRRWAKWTGCTGSRKVPEDPYAVGRRASEQIVNSVHSEHIIVPAPGVVTNAGLESTAWSRTLMRWIKPYVRPDFQVPVPLVGLQELCMQLVDFVGDRPVTKCNNEGNGRKEVQGRTYLFNDLIAEVRSRQRADSRNWTLQIPVTQLVSWARAVLAIARVLPPQLVLIAWKIIDIFGVIYEDCGLPGDATRLVDEVGEHVHFK